MNKRLLTGIIINFLGLVLMFIGIFTTPLNWLLIMLGLTVWLPAVYVICAGIWPIWNRTVLIGIIMTILGGVLFVAGLLSTPFNWFLIIPGMILEGPALFVILGAYTPIWNRTLLIGVIMTTLGGVFLLRGIFTNPFDWFLILLSLILSVPGGYVTLAGLWRL